MKWVPVCCHDDCCFILKHDNICPYHPELNQDEETKQETNEVPLEDLVF